MDKYITFTQQSLVLQTSKKPSTYSVQFLDTKLTKDET